VSDVRDETAFVSFGQWPTHPPFDRFPNVPPTPAQNVHLLTPYFPTIKARGSVNFIIAGLHNVQIFEPGIKPEDINKGLVTGMTGPAPFTDLPIIDDPVGRIYRGPDPSFCHRIGLRPCSSPDPAGIWSSAGSFSTSTTTCSVTSGCCPTGATKTISRRSNSTRGAQTIAHSSLKRRIELPQAAHDVPRDITA
jgi:hypothetical protein